jgi:hypothetical protein
MLLLPHHHEFAETLANLPSFYNAAASQTCETLHAIQKNPNYLPEFANTNQLNEYLLGGEAEQFVEFVDGYADEPIETEEETESNFLNPWELGDEWLGSI